jgi:long-subunit acyl-CoA synthetase (AMP-forming)
MRRLFVTYTYSDLLDHANKVLFPEGITFKLSLTLQVGAMLTSMKVPERSVCLFLSKSTFPLIASYLGAIAANCVPAILHEDVADADLVHIANDSKAAVVFVASQHVSEKNPQQLPDKFVQSILPKLAHCKHVVLLPPDSLNDAGMMQKLPAEASMLASKFNSKSTAPGEQRRGCSFNSWSDALAMDSGAHQIALEARSNNICIDSCCCVCYGSSAGRARPVGSMLSHDNILWTARVFAENYLRLQVGDIIAATLPMAFALSQVVYIAASLQAGSIVSFPRTQSSSFDIALSYLVETQPHVVLCTPLQFKSLLSEIDKLPIASQATVSAKEMGLLGGRAAAMGQSKPRFYGWNRRRVFSKIWQSLGLARCKFLGSYGDVCSQQLTERFMAMGLCLCNVYGCNEATGVIAATKNDPARPQLPLAHEWKFGRVGRCIPGCQVRAVVRANSASRLEFVGRNAFMGYLNRETDSTADGYVDTGDCGSLEDSFVEVEGRNSDLIALSTGAFFHAASIQSAIEQGLPGTARAILIGHGLPHVSVMCEFLQDSGKGSLSQACIAWQREKFSDPSSVQVTAAGALASESFMRHVAVALHVSGGRPAMPAAAADSSAGDAGCREV